MFEGFEGCSEGKSKKVKGDWRRVLDWMFVEIENVSGERGVMVRVEPVPRNAAFVVIGIDPTEGFTVGLADLRTELFEKDGIVRGDLEFVCVV